MNARSSMWLTLILTLVLISAGGCRTGRPVIIPEETPVLLAEDVVARISVMVDGEMVLVPDRRLIPAGRWVVPYSWAFED